MGFPTIELDDLPGALPVTVDLESLAGNHDPVVESGAWEIMSAQERQKPFLQPAPGATGGQSFDAGQCSPQPPHSASAWVSINHVNERQAVIEPPVFGLTNRALDAIDGRVGG
jgi:hypothetical protein